MFCEKCNDSFYCQGMSEGECKVYKTPTPTPHMPSYDVCKKCSDTYGLCEQCGVKIDGGDPSHIEKEKKFMNDLKVVTDEELIDEIKKRGYKVAGVSIKFINEKIKDGAKSIADDFCSQFDNSVY